MVKQAMRLHKSPQPPPSQPPPPPASPITSLTHPLPLPHRSNPSPDIFHVLRLFDHLRDRESRLLTQLLQLKLVNKSSSVEATSRNAQISALSAKVQDLEGDNERMRKEMVEVMLGVEVAREENKRRIGELEAEIEEMKKSASSSSSDSECSSMRGGDTMLSLSVEKRTGLTAVRSGVKNVAAGDGGRSNDVAAESQPIERWDSKREHEVVEIKRPRHDSDEVVEFIRLPCPRVPKPPPPKKSSSLPPLIMNLPPEKASAPPPPSTPLPLTTTKGRPKREQVPTTAPPPPPFPPPPPPHPAPTTSRTVPPPPSPPPALRAGRAAVTKVRRVPKVFEFYHSVDTQINLD